ncbi:Chromosome partition protein Smc [Nymphon striatum]|nr:Chromosome partition protein Smc [Nymphon striatum]
MSKHDLVAGKRHGVAHVVRTVVHNCRLCEACREQQDCAKHDGADDAQKALLAAQLAQLARQARQAARYREIGEDLRKSEGMLLYRRWKEAEEANLAASQTLTERTKLAAVAEAQVREVAKLRQGMEDALPPLREEEAIAAAILQRLQVQRDTLTDQERQAQQTIETLTARIDQLGRDIERETALNHDAGETIERLEWESREIAKASEGHHTEDVARLAARHQSAHRLRDDAAKTLQRYEDEETKARASVDHAQAAATNADTALIAAQTALSQASVQAEKSDADLSAAETARSDAQNRESDARSQRSEAEGEANALRAEATALSRLVDRDTSEQGQLLDVVQVKSGYEKALGAALADDLRAPQID